MGSPQGSISLITGHRAEPEERELEEGAHLGWAHPEFQSLEYSAQDRLGFQE